MTGAALGWREGSGRVFRTLGAWTHEALAGIGQTVFIGTPRVGALLALGLAVFDLRLALAGVLASVAARVGAASANLPYDLRRSGLAELNGWFAGLAAAGFFPGPVALVVGPLLGLTTGASLGVVRRVLAPWDLPVMVAAYLVPFWIVWSTVGATHGAMPASPTSLASVTEALPLGSGALAALASTLVGSLRGLGEIFFLPDARLGVVILAVVALASWRVAVAMLAAAVGGAAVSTLVGAPAWFIDAGLGAYTPALFAAAAGVRFRGIGWGAVGVSTVVAPLATWAAMVIAGRLALPALSVVYVASVWFAVLVPSTAGDPLEWRSRGRPLDF